MNSNRDQKQHPKPFKLPMPWPEFAAAEEVTDEERATLRADLRNRSAFAN